MELLGKFRDPEDGAEKYVFRTSDGIIEASRVSKGRDDRVDDYRKLKRCARSYRSVWSSEENNSNTAHYVFFAEGKEGIANKGLLYLAIPIKKIKLEDLK